MYMLVLYRSGLFIQLYYTPGHLNTFIGINYAGKIDPKKHEGLKASTIEIVV